MYEYDSNFVPSATFAATILALVLAPASLHVIKPLFVSTRNSVGTAKLLATKERIPRRLKSVQLDGAKRSKLSLRTVIQVLCLVAGYAALLYLIHFIRVTPEDKPEVWNPWQILGISEGADPKTIKRAHKTLSMQYHPDKVDPSQAEEAAKRYIDISKAKLVLTDDDEFKKWEESGSPDGTQGMKMGIAIPVWIVSSSNSPFVMLFYLLLFGIIPPYYIAKWWYSSSRVTKDGVLKSSMAKFFRGLREKISLRDVVELLASADEFISDPEFIYNEQSEAIALNELSEKVHDAMVMGGSGVRLDGIKDRATPTGYKILVLLYAHFYRVPITHQPFVDQQLLAVVKGVHLLQGMITITTTHNWYKCTAQLLDVSVMLVQGCPPHASSLLAVPHVELDGVKRAKAVTPAVYNTKHFLAATDGVRRAILGPRASEDSLKEAVTIAASVPRVKVARAFFKVIGDRVITPHAIVTMVVQIESANHPTILAKQLAQLNGADECFSDCADSACCSTTPSSAGNDANGHVHSDSKDIYAEMDEIASGAADGGSRGGCDDGCCGSGPSPSNDNQADVDAEMLARQVYAPRFAVPKRANWYLFLIDQRSGRCIIPMKKISDLVTSTTVKLQFQAPPQLGTYTFKLVIKSDAVPGRELMMDMPLTIQDPAELPAEDRMAVEDDISDPEQDSIAGQMAQMRGQQSTHQGGDDSDDD